MVVVPTWDVKPLLQAVNCRVELLLVDIQHLIVDLEFI